MFSLVQDAVKLCTAQGEEFARALINYSHEEVAKVQASALDCLAVCLPCLPAPSCTATWHAARLSGRR